MRIPVPIRAGARQLLLNPPKWLAVAWGSLRCARVIGPGPRDTLFDLSAFDSVFPLGLEAEHSMVFKPGLADDAVLVTGVPICVLCRFYHCYWLLAHCVAPSADAGASGCLTAAMRGATACVAFCIVAIFRSRSSWSIRACCRRSS